MAEQSTTGTTAGARAHARAQEAEQGPLVAERPWVPARDAPAGTDLPPGVDRDDLVWSERLRGGGYASRELARGAHVRLADVTGDTCAAVVLHAAGRPHERLSVADTGKVQWQAYPGVGQLLLSGLGRVLASVVEDTSGHHDAVFGTSSRVRNEERYGDGAPEGPSPAGRDLLVLGAARHGLGRRDVPPCVTFFQGVRVGPPATGGRAEWLGSAGPGTSVVLRLEVPAVLTVATTAHPLDPRPAWSCGPLDVLAWRGRPTAPSDPLWSGTPERRRAFEATAEHLLARGVA